LGSGAAIVVKPSRSIRKIPGSDSPSTDSSTAMSPCSLIEGRESVPNSENWLVEES